MERKPVIDFDEKHGKGPVAKEKDKAGTTNKKLPKQLAVGVLLTESKANKVETKNLGEQKLYNRATSKTESMAEAVEQVTALAEETANRKERPAAKTSRQAIITELIIDADANPEWRLPDSDRAWELVNPNRQDRVAIEALPSQKDLAARRLTVKKYETSEEKIEIGSNQIPEVSVQTSTDVLLADGKIHELLKITDSLHQHLDQGPDTLIIRHETGQAILVEEGQSGEAPAVRSSSDTGERVLPAQEPAVYEGASAGSYTGSFETSQLLHGLEVPIGHPEPERPMALVDRLEAPVFPWASLFESSPTKPPETTLAADKASKERAAETRPLAGLVKQLNKVTKLFTRSERQPEGTRKRFSYHVVERERELIRERQQVRLQKQVAQIEQIYRSKPASIPETWQQPAGQKPELGKGQSRQEGSVNTRPETVPSPVRTAVAETAVEHVLHLPPDHRLLKSAWHSIEVDKSGKAVEQPVFVYGHEFMQEQRQEAQSYKAPLTAVQTGLLAFSDDSRSLNTDFGVQPASLQSSSSPSSPNVRIEKSALEPTQWRLTRTDQTVGLIIIITIILLSITGLILLY
jgi:hypothetical protein